jgi:hypothetical protein
MRNERFDTPPVGRVLIEDTWDCCRNDFEKAKESLTQCTERLDAMVTLANAVQDVANRGPDHIAEAQQNYLQIRIRHHQNSVFRNRREREGVTTGLE